MKRIRLLLAIVVAVFWVSKINAQTYTGIYQLNENYSTATAPWGFGTIGSNTTITIPNAGTVNGTNYGNVFQLYINNAGGKRVSNKTFSPIYSTSATSTYNGKLYVEFDWQAGSPAGTSNGGIMRFYDGTNIIFTVGIEYNSTATNNVLHYGNLSPTNVTSPNSATTLVIPSSGTFVRNEWYHIAAELDFSTHIVNNITFTRKSNNTVYTISDKAFISTPATTTGITKFELEGGRYGAVNGSWTTQIDNFQIYTLTDVETPTGVTSNSPQCTGSLITLSSTNSAPSGETWYWQHWGYNRFRSSCNRWHCHGCKSRNTEWSHNINQFGWPIGFHPMAKFAKWY
jgi:hypothetical protein